MEHEKDLSTNFIDGLNRDVDGSQERLQKKEEREKRRVRVTDTSPFKKTMLYQEDTGAVIFKEGDMSLIAGLAKSRKTTFVVGLSSALLGKKTLGLEATSPNFRVGIVDTEQGKDESRLTQIKVYKNMGWSMDKDNDRLLYYDVSEDDIKTRRDIVANIVEEENLDFIFIDGLVDLCANFNNEEECSTLINWLINLREKTKTHICCCIHFNKDGETVRGHLGAMYQQKCYSTFELRKPQSSEYCTEVRAGEQGHRYKHFRSFLFKPDDRDGIPELFDLTSEVKKGTAGSRSKEYADESFLKNGNKPMRSAELVRLMVEESRTHGGTRGMGISNKTALNYIKALCEEGYLYEYKRMGKAKVWYALTRFKTDRQKELDLSEVVKEDGESSEN